MAYPFDGAVYDQIARQYDDLHFWTKRVRAESGPVLELGLGTGRLAIRLAREAVAYHGIEAELSMIAALRSNLLSATPTNRCGHLTIVETWRAMYGLLASPALSHTRSEVNSGFRLLKFCRMLFDDPVTQHVSHVQYLLMDSVVSRNVRLPIAFEPRNDFSGG
jgi:SAM-dependent methyltransferase